MTAAYHFPLSEAFLCCEEQCASISDNAMQCPACAGRSLRSLSAILNRTPVTMLGAPNPFSCVEDCRAN